MRAARPKAQDLTFEIEDRPACRWVLVTWRQKPSVAGEKHHWCRHSKNLKATSYRHALSSVGAEDDEAMHRMRATRAQ